MYRIDHTKTTMENMVGLANEKYVITNPAKDKLVLGDFVVAGAPASIIPGAGNGNSNTSLLLTGANSSGHFGQTTIYYDRFTIAESRPTAGNTFLGEEDATHADNHAKIIEKLRLVGEEIVFTDPALTPAPGRELLYRLSPKTNSLIYSQGDFDVLVRTKGEATGPAVPAMQSDTWLKVASGPVGRASHVAVTIGGKLYIHGGWSVWTNTPIADLWRYDPLTNVWEQLANGPALGGHAAFVVNGILYTYGGSTQVGNTSSTGSAQVWKYDPSTNIWTQLANGPQSPFLHRSAVINNIAYFMGGYAGGMLTSSCRTYDPVNNLWGTFNTDINLYGHGMVAHGDELYRYFGRNTTTTIAARTDKLTTPSGSWVSVPYTAPPSQCYGAAYATVFNKTYLHGGDNITDTVYDQFYRHDPVTNVWTIRNKTGGPSARRNHSMTEINGRLYLFGGQTVFAGTTFSNELWVYKP